MHRFSPLFRSKHTELSPEIFTYSQVIGTIVDQHSPRSTFHSNGSSWQIANTCAIICLLCGWFLSLILFKTLSPCFPHFSMEIGLKAILYLQSLGRRRIQNLDSVFSTPLYCRWILILLQTHTNQFLSYPISLTQTEHARWLDGRNQGELS